MSRHQPETVDRGCEVVPGAVQVALRRGDRPMAEEPLRLRPRLWPDCFGTAALGAVSGLAIARALIAGGWL